MHNDRLAWWEEIPLGLALLAQSYVVGLWYYASIAGAAWWVDLIVAILAGLALDLIVVTTVMGRRAGRSSLWSWLTALGAFGCSALIALDRYGWEWRSGLHIAFPLVVFLYSQHLATPRKRSVSAQTETATEALAALQERSRSLEGTGAVSLPAPIGSSASVAPALEGARFLDALLAVPLEESASESSASLEPSAPGQAVASGAPEPLALSAYTCDFCQAPLKNKQAVGAMRTNGYCRACKAERLAAA